MRSVTRTVALTVLALTGVGLVPVSPVAAAEPWTAPRSERIIAGPSRPGLAAWGVAHNPVTDEIVVSDYVAHQVRRYSRDGVHLGDFSNPGGDVAGVGSAVAVDRRDGSVYLAVSGGEKTSKSVRKYDKEGRFLFDFNLRGSTTWLTVDDQGRLWAPQAFSGATVRGYTVDDTLKTATEFTSLTSTTSCSPLRWLNGIDVDAAGNVYVADPIAKTVHVFRPDGSCLRDLGGPTVFKGDMRGVHVDDARGRVYVANSHVGTIEVFDVATGSRVQTFSGLGEGVDRMVDGARQLATTPDGHLLAADYGGRRVVEFEVGPTSARYVSDFPAPRQLPDAAGLADPRGLAVDPATGDVITVDGWNQRVQRFSPNGTLLRVHGGRGSFLPAGMNYPRSADVDPVTGDVWLPNYEGDPDLVVYDRDFGVLGSIDTPRFVNDIDIHAGQAYALVRNPGYVQVYSTTPDASGQYPLVRTIRPGLGQLRGISVDPATGNLWLTHDSTRDVYVLSPTGTLLRTLAADARPWGVVVSGDVVYVADSSSGAVIAFDRVSYARLGSFGGNGSAPGQLRGPSSIDVDAQGRVHVVEQRNGRVQVFGWSAQPPAETAAPVVTFTSPAQQTTTPVVVTGTVSDASGVAETQVQVRDTTTGLYWNARTGQWGSATWSPAIHWGPLTSAQWRLTVVPSEEGRSYVVRARGLDVHGNVGRTPVSRTFSTPG